MARFEIPLDQFDLRGFIESIVDFWGSETALRPCVESGLEVEEDPNFDYLAWLREEDHCLLLSFSGSYVDQPVKCVDGAFIDPADEKHDPRLREETTFAEDAGYAFELSLTDQKLCIDFVLDGESISHEDHAGMLEQPMCDYVRRFKNPSYPLP